MKVYLGDRTVELLKQVLFRNLCKLDLINHYLLIIPRAKRSDKERYSIDCWRYSITRLVKTFWKMLLDLGINCIKYSSIIFRF